MDSEKLSSFYSQLLPLLAEFDPTSPVPALVTFAPTSVDEFSGATLEGSSAQLAVSEQFSDIGPFRAYVSRGALTFRHVISDLRPLPGGQEASMSWISNPETRLTGAVINARPEVLIRMSDWELVDSIQEDPLYQVHLDRIGPAVGVHSAHQNSYRGSGITLAVIDSGIDAGHPAFAGRISPLSMNFSSEGAPTDISDTNGHGTHVAGIAAGDGSPGTAYCGVAPEATILVCKVFNSSGFGSAGDISKAVDYAVQNGADVVNFSGGYPGRPHLPPPWVWSTKECFEESVFNAAVARGSAIVVSAGNLGVLRPADSTVTLPATMANVLSVGSVHEQSGTWSTSSFSSQGPVLRTDNLGARQFTHAGGLGTAIVKTEKPDVVAPGGEVDWTAAAGGCRYPDGVTSALAKSAGITFSKCQAGTDPYTRCSGTSMAAPVVAGLAALVFQYSDRHNLPLRSRLDRAFVVQQIVKRTAKDLGLPATQQGAGLVEWDAIESALDAIRRGRTSFDDFAPVA